MLQNLYVKNLALIDETEVEFGEGLNILTGETGAGKSILLGSVTLALGGKYNAQMLRNGAKSGLVELTFHIKEEKILKKLEALDIYPEDGYLTLSRRLLEGRSVSKINGETVNMSVLKDVASLLIDIHGQHDNQTLLGYYGNKSDKELNFMMNYLHIKRVSQIPKAMLRAAYASIADTVIFQMQDILELDDTARMNEPSTVGTNWRWRMQPGAFDGKKIKMLRKMCKLYAR